MMADGSVQVLAAAVTRDSTIGVGYLGVAVASMVYGITCVQAFQYYRSPRATSDPAIVRYLVLVLWVLDSIQEAFGIHAFYLLIVHDLDNPWSISGGILSNAIISSLVKTFFLVRIWRLSHGNIFVTATCGIFNVARFALNLCFPILTISTGGPNFGALEVKYRAIGCAGLALEVAADIVTSVPMVYYLSRLNGTGLRRSDDMITRLIVLAVATGMLSTLVAAADFISLLVAPGDFYVLFFNLLIAKMDVNALLTSLNTRQFVRDGTGSSGLGNDPRTYPLGNISNHAQRSRGSISDSRSGDNTGIVCKVDIDAPFVV